MQLTFPRGGCVLLAIATLAFFQPAAFAQIQLLVDPEAGAAHAWKTAQIESIAEQLDKPELPDELRAELSSQKQWLEAWIPGELTSGSLWPEPKAISQQTAWKEPVLDPNGRAAAVREKLFGRSAKPTRQDTQALTQLLSKFPDDLGVRQLHLQWLDQYQYRKTYADEIVVAADIYLKLLSETQATELLPEEALKRGRAYGLYRKVRGLAYRELPEVVAKSPIPDVQAHTAALLGTYAELKQTAGEGRAEFILIEIRMLRRDHWHGRGLRRLEDYGQRIDPKWLLKKRRDILSDLAWEIPAKEAAALYEKEFPQAAQAEKDAAALQLSDG